MSEQDSFPGQGRDVQESPGITEEQAEGGAAVTGYSHEFSGKSPHFQIAASPRQHAGPETGTYHSQMGPYNSPAGQYHPGPIQAGEHSEVFSPLNSGHQIQQSDSEWTVEFYSQMKQQEGDGLTVASEYQRAHVQFLTNSDVFQGEKVSPPPCFLTIASPADFHALHQSPVSTAVPGGRIPLFVQPVPTTVPVTNEMFSGHPVFPMSTFQYSPCPPSFLQTVPFAASPYQQPHMLGMHMTEQQHRENQLQLDRQQFELEKQRQELKIERWNVDIEKEKLEQEKEHLKQEKQKLQKQRREEKKQFLWKIRDLELPEQKQQTFEASTIQGYIGTPLFLHRQMAAHSALPGSSPASFQYSPGALFHNTSPQSKMTRLSPTGIMVPQRLVEPAVYPNPGISSHSHIVPASLEDLVEDVSINEDIQPVQQFDTESEFAGPDPRLRLTAKPFIPQNQQHRQPSPPMWQHHYHLPLSPAQLPQQRRPRGHDRQDLRHQPISPRQTRASSSQIMRSVSKEDVQRVNEELRHYALQSLAPNSKDDQYAVQQILGKIVRVPAVYFNEQKLEDREGYQVLHQPQSPAVRGQEALARVCWAMEQSLRYLGQAAFMVCDYKYKESYLKKAPKRVLDVLTRPAEEGSHDLLIVGPDIGVVCLQVTCIETTTNSSTMKKQLRDTLKQLHKDFKVINEVMKDLDLGDSITMAMALPNIAADLLKQKLEPKTLQSFAAQLQTSKDLQDILTLDYLPCVGQRYWPSTKSRDKLLNWIQRLRGKGKRLHLDACIQLFARYTCPWSLTEVWGTSKPRIQVRSDAHAVQETARRHHSTVLTQKQHQLMDDEHARRVLIESPQGCGTSLLLQLRAMKELKRPGCVVLVFLPQAFTGMRQNYRRELSKLSSQFEQSFSGEVYFWSRIKSETDTFSPLREGSHSKSLTDLTAGNGNVFAIFDLINRDADLIEVLASMTKTAAAIWVTSDQPIRNQHIFTAEQFHKVQFSALTRVPTSLQALMKLAGLTQHGTSLKEAASDVDWTGSPSSLLIELADNSSSVGLPTDGPQPLFILHPHVQDSDDASVTIGTSGIIDCHVCLEQLRDIFLDLSNGSFQRRSGYNDHGKERNIPEPTAGITAGTVETADALAAESAGHSQQETKAEGGEIKLNIHSGNIPTPLEVDDFAIFTDSQEDAQALVAVLDLINIGDNIVHHLSNLNAVIGTEKAVVTYVGKVKVIDKPLLHALVPRLLEVMALCQGQLILVIEVEEGYTPADDVTVPYQVDMEMLIDQAKRRHGNQEPHPP